MGLVDILWVALELNPCIKNSSRPPNLADFCVEKLITDVFLLRQKVHCLPKKIFSILFAKAVERGRILSVVELIKHCPFEEIELEIPGHLREFSTAASKLYSYEAKNTDKLYNVAISILTTFLNFVRKKSGTSRLKTLNFGHIPLNGTMLQLLNDFLSGNEENFNKISSNLRNFKFNLKSIRSFYELQKCSACSSKTSEETPDLPEEYVLKGSLILNEFDLRDVLRWYFSAKKIGLKLMITGLLYYNDKYKDNHLTEVKKIISLEEFQLFGVVFAEFAPHPENIFVVLKEFKYLKYLTFSSVRSIFNVESVFQEFLRAFSELTSLKRLAFHSVNLNGRLTDIFSKFCKRKLDSGCVTNCCLAHSGSLEYLDISSCFLSNIEVLKEFSSSRSLKFLDISGNNLEVRSTLQTLLVLSSDLEVLYMGRCFRGRVEYSAEIFPLSAFTQIRILTMTGMKMNLRNIRMLHSELEKMTFECIITDAEPPYDFIIYDQFKKLCALQIQHNCSLIC